MNEAADRTWEQVRATRYAPAAPAAADAARKQTYGASLEQGQQLFRAASAVGPEAQPLLIFYGLSQAGRAIAAAAASPEAAEDGWKLRGHGIRAKNLNAPLRDVQVAVDEPNSRGSFVKLSRILGSPLWDPSSTVPFTKLWDCLPENDDWPLHDAEEERRTPLYVEARYLTEAVALAREIEPSTLVSVDVGDFPTWVAQSERPRKALDTYLSAFPDALPFHSFLRSSPEPDADPDFNLHIDGKSDLLMHWELPDGASGTAQERVEYLNRRVRQYAGAPYFFPAVDGGDCGIHPLMAWWAVLHSLSMLARYQPDEWVEHIDVDRSRGVAIERILREALTVVPQLILEAIEEVASP